MLDHRSAHPALSCMSLINSERFLVVLWVCINLLWHDLLWSLILRYFYIIENRGWGSGSAVKPLAGISQCGSKIEQSLGIYQGETGNVAQWANTCLEFTSKGFGMWFMNKALTYQYLSNTWSSTPKTWLMTTIIIVNMHDPYNKAHIFVKWFVPLCYA